MLEGKRLNEWKNEKKKEKKERRKRKKEQNPSLTSLPSNSCAGKESTDSQRKKTKTAPSDCTTMRAVGEVSSTHINTCTFNGFLRSWTTVQVVRGTVTSTVPAFSAELSRERYSDIKNTCIFCRVELWQIQWHEQCLHFLHSWVVRDTVTWILAFSAELSWEIQKQQQYLHFLLSWVERYRNSNNTYIFCGVESWEIQRHQQCLHFLRSWEKAGSILCLGRKGHQLVWTLSWSTDWPAMHLVEGYD